MGLKLMIDIHASPPPFEFDFLLSPNSNPKDEMSTDQGSIKIEEVREKEKEQEDGGDGDVSMTTGMFLFSLPPLPFNLFIPAPSLILRPIHCYETFDQPIGL
jgi:hypothetical protein